MRKTSHSVFSLTLSHRTVIMSFIFNCRLPHMSLANFTFGELEYRVRLKPGIMIKPCRFKG